jgi:5-hydroxyisourate hydrolase
MDGIMKQRSPITTHILDLARGQPAAGVPVELSRQEGEAWQAAGRGATNGDGRVESLLPADQQLKPGTYKLRFDTTAYFSSLKTESFYPEVTITFHVRQADEHYHVPLLISPFGYSTYRGS